MSELAEELKAQISETASTVWSSRDGRVVPDTDDLTLGNDRVVLDAVLLYADLADSTEMATKNQVIAAKIFKSYLNGVTRLIRANSGDVRSFDGDRVMGVFIGDHKNTNAARCGLQVNWLFQKVLVTEFRAFYKEKV